MHPDPGPAVEQPRSEPPWREPSPADAAIPMAAPDRAGRGAAGEEEGAGVDGELDVEALRAEAERLARALDARAAQLSAREAEASRLREELRRLRLVAERAAQPRGARRLWESLRRAAAIRRLRACGLFDEEHYRRAYPDVAGQDPVRHFAKYGRWGGRNPHPLFDTAYYLEQNPAVARRREDPLLHFAREGAAQGRRPHPAHTAEELLRRARSPAPASPAGGEPRAVPPRAAPARPGRFRTRPLLDALAARRGEAPAAVTLMAAHVLPTPPRAGNEYRIHRMLRWLRAAGHEVHLVVCPLPGEEPTREQLERAARAHPHLYVCGRDGSVLHSTERTDLRALLRGMDGEAIRSLPAPRSRVERLEPVEQTFCPAPLVDLLSRLAEALDPDVFLVNYVFLSRALAHAPSRALRIIDTHDVFSTKARKVVQFGVADGLSLTAAEEATLLRRAELLLAIQPEEARELAALAPDRAVVTAGVDFDVEPAPPPPPDPVALYVGSGNGLNVRGLRDFLALAWPTIRRARPDARLLVVGPICDAVDGGADGVELLGRVDRLADAYARARVVVNPAVAGTGLKIKTVEALAAQRPVVVWPSGVDGMGPELRRLCHVAQDWYGFARAVLRHLDGGAPRLPRADELAGLLSPGRVYAALDAALAAHVRPARAGAVAGV